MHLKPGPAPGWSLFPAFHLQEIPAQSQMLLSHPSPTFCLSSNLSLLGSFKPQIPFFPLILLQGPRGGWRLRWPQFPPGPLCRDKEPWVPVAVSSGRVPWLWPRGMLRMALCSLFLIAGPRQLVKGSALCPPVPAALGRARAQPLRADFGVTHKTSLG